MVSIRTKVIWWVGQRRFSWPELIGGVAIWDQITERHYWLAAVIFAVTIGASIIIDAAIKAKGIEQGGRFVSPRGMQD